MIHLGESSSNAFIEDPENEMINILEFFELYFYL